MVDGFDALWIFAHHEPGVPELEVRDSSGSGGIILRVDVEAHGFHVCLGVGPCRRGCDVALSVPDLMKSI